MVPLARLLAAERRIQPCGGGRDERSCVLAGGSSELWRFGVEDHHCGAERGCQHGPGGLGRPICVFDVPVGSSPI